jgi:dTDP-4-dehydrorhamnose reductase
MKKVLLTGANGMLGTTLSEQLEQNGFSVIKTDVNEMDITNEENIKDVLNKSNPDVLINCAAFTNVDAAETQKELAYNINALAVKYLAKYTNEHNIMFLHISTDYVFGDNKREGYLEDDEPGENQLNYYGKTKREGEKLAIEYNPNSYIIRTSWTFGPNGKNFINTMLNLSTTKEELTIVDDEVGVPTYTKDLAIQLIYIINNRNNLNPGYYHGVNEGSCSRYQEAKKIFELARKDIKLHKTTLEKYGRAVKTANYSVLLNTKLPKLQDWDKAIEEYINSLI